MWGRVRSHGKIFFRLFLSERGTSYKDICTSIPNFRKQTIESIKDQINIIMIITGDLNTSLSQIDRLDTLLNIL